MLKDTMELCKNNLTAATKQTNEQANNERKRPNKIEYLLQIQYTKTSPCKKKGTN